MIYTHTIGRIGKDCRVITGTHGTFMSVDIAVDDYSKGKNITTWVRVKSNKENHIRLAEYLTKGRMVLIEGTLRHLPFGQTVTEKTISSTASSLTPSPLSMRVRRTHPTPLRQRHARQPRQRVTLPNHHPMHHRTRAKTFHSEGRIY